MKKNNFIFSVIIFLLHLIPLLFAPIDISWYEKLSKPLFMPPLIIIYIIWCIVFMIISFLSTNIISLRNHESKRFFIILIILNYFFIQFYPYIMFSLKDIFLGFVNLLLMLLTVFMLYIVSSKINQKLSIYMIIVMLWVLFNAFLQCGLLKYN